MEGGRTEDSPIIERPPYEYTGRDADITAELSRVSAILSKYYTYSSYDQYQALKKLYYNYKDSTTADEYVLTQFEQAISRLSQFTGEIKVYALRDKYYFENNKSWSKVYGYAWDGSDKNADWPGVKLSKVGQNNGHDVYVVNFDSAGQYKNLIFTDGNDQTVDIGLYDYEGNCFKLSDKSDNKYKVSNYQFGPDDPIIPPPTPSHEYALLYYVSGEHDWSDTSSLFTYNESDGTYIYTFRSKGSQNMSFSLYDKTDKVYQSMTESASLIYSDGETAEYTLSKQSSRGKSITIKELSENLVVNIVYNPTSNSVTVICGDIKPALENTSTISSDKIKLGEKTNVKCSAAGGAGDYTYAVLYKKVTDEKWATKQDYQSNDTVTITPAKATDYKICVRAKDSAGTVSKAYFTLTVQPAELTNRSAISADSVKTGESVTVNAAASGGSGGYTYAVYYKKTSDSKWATKQDYKSNTVIKITPAKATEYQICVKVKDSSGAVSKAYFTLTVQPAELTNRSAISADSVKTGESVTVNAAASGGSGGYTYAVYYKKTSDSKWATKQDYKSNTVIKITPAKATEYQICVKVKDSSGTIAKKYFTVTVT